MNRFLILLLTLAQLTCFCENLKSTNSHQFLTDLTNTLSENPGSVCLSSYSIRKCLLMLMLGAKNQTYIDLTNALYPHGFSKEQLYKGNTSKDKNAYCLESAAKLYVHKDEQLLDLFVHHSLVFLRAEAEKNDFTDPENTVDQINTWVSKKTNNLINKFVSTNDITPSLRLLLLNTLYFKGAWRFPFDKHLAEKKPFYLRKSTEGLVPFEGTVGSQHSGSKLPIETIVSLKKKNYRQKTFLIQNEKYPYFEDTTCQVVILPFKNAKDQPKMGFVIYLPKKFSEKPLKDSLDYFSGMNKLAFKFVDLHLEIPKFKIMKTFNLNDSLKAIGIKDAFGRKADFSKINGKKNLYVSKVLHKCLVELNESGVSAAAATGAFMNLTCVRETPPLKSFIANKPFAFMILDLSNNVCLFAGQYYPV